MGRVKISSVQWLCILYATVLIVVVIHVSSVNCIKFYAIRTWLCLLIYWHIVSINHFAARMMKQSYKRLLIKKTPATSSVISTLSSGRYDVCCRTTRTLSDSCRPLDGRKRKPSQAERREDGTALGRLEIFRSCVRQQPSVSEARSRHCHAE